MTRSIGSTTAAESMPPFDTCPRDDERWKRWHERILRFHRQCARRDRARRLLPAIARPRWRPVLIYAAPVKSGNSFAPPPRPFIIRSAPVEWVRIRLRWWIPRCEVIGLDGLRIADASIFPSIMGGNTNAPTVMVAEKAADLPAESHPSHDIGSRTRSSRRSMRRSISWL